MACLGGFLPRGAQPKALNNEIRKKRKQVLLNLDQKNQQKFAHKNPLVKEIYQKFLNSTQLPITNLLVNSNNF